jgi:hypothetical protein
MIDPVFTQSGQMGNHIANPPCRTGGYGYIGVVGSNQQGEPFSHELVRAEVVGRDRTLSHHLEADAGRLCRDCKELPWTVKTFQMVFASVLEPDA